MKVLDFEFKKINAEKINNFNQEPKIESNIDLIEIKKIEIDNKNKDFKQSQLKSVYYTLASVVPNEKNLKKKSKTFPTFDLK